MYHFIQRTFPTIFWYLERLNRPPRLSCIFRPQIYTEWEVLVRQKDETWLSLWPLAVKASQTLLVADGWWLVSWPNMHCRQHPVRICSFFLKNFSKHCQKMLKNISNKKKELHSFIHLVKWSDGNSVRSMVTREKATEIDIWLGVFGKIDCFSFCSFGPFFIIAFKFIGLFSSEDSYFDIYFNWVPLPDQ